MSDNESVTEAQFCSNCNTAIRLERDTKNGTYLLKCACNKEVAVPRTWSFWSWD